jgi:dienelactone hydrolase
MFDLWWSAAEGVLPKNWVRPKVCLCVAAFLWAGAICTLRAQKLEVTPNQALSDQTVVIRATGLQRNQSVTIQATLIDGAGQHWISQADFLADAQGSVDVSRQAPVKGTYSDVSAMGLVWSMKPEDKAVTRYQPPRDLGTQIIEFKLLDAGRPVASALLGQRTVEEGVRQIKVEGQLHGVLFLPGTSGPYPGVLVVGGSEGGLPVAKAAWLASHGFAAFALAYFRYEDLPKELEAIPLEYFGRALAWLRQRPEIITDRIAVVGTSRGGELALQLGSMYPHIRAVVAYVSANIRYPACCGDTRVPYAWTWQGRPLAYSLVTKSRINPAAVMQAAIAVEQTQGPVLLISGDDDGVWPSSVMANSIVSRLKDAHFRYPVEHLDYSHAGHLAGRPEIVPAWLGAVWGRATQFGGTAKGNADSSLDAIPKVLEFLRTSLEATAPSK